MFGCPRLITSLKAILSSISNMDTVSFFLKNSKKCFRGKERKTEKILVNWAADLADKTKDWVYMRSHPI